MAARKTGIRGLVINPESGEITGDIREGDILLRKESVEYLKSIQDWKLEHFFMGNIEEITRIMDELSVYESAFLFRIVPYIGYEDCHLRYSNGEDIGTTDLIKISRMDKRTVIKVISSLIKKDIIYKGKNSKNRQYFINPWLFCKGNRINRVLKTMFKNYRIRVLNGVKWKDV